MVLLWCALLTRTSRGYAPARCAPFDLDLWASRATAAYVCTLSAGSSQLCKRVEEQVGVSTLGTLVRAPQRQAFLGTYETTKSCLKRSATCGAYAYARMGFQACEEQGPSRLAIRSAMHQPRRPPPPQDPRHHHNPCDSRAFAALPSWKHQAGQQFAPCSVPRYMRLASQHAASLRHFAGRPSAGPWREIRRRIKSQRLLGTGAR